MFAINGPFLALVSLTEQTVLEYMQLPVSALQKKVIKHGTKTSNHENSSTTKSLKEEDQ